VLPLGLPITRRDVGTKRVAVVTSEAKQSSKVLQPLDCRVADLLAMTTPLDWSDFGATKCLRHPN
jgi:hypothetical protein